MAQGKQLEFTDNDLRLAIERCHSWRGVMRYLGYTTTNGHIGRRLRERAQDLGIDLSHFSGQRTWSVNDLAAAIAASTSWSEVLDRLNLTPDSTGIARVRGYAERLGYDYRHIATIRQPNGEMPFTAEPNVDYLRTAGQSLAVAWFARRGYTASVPVEPRPYDLIVEAAGSLYRVQVKTATVRERSGAITCQINRTPLRDGKRHAYDPADVDFFFIIDADGHYYIVPLREVGGAQYVTLSTVQHRKVSVP
jgi:hypothetical protein